jgi:hypothetical protein
MIVSRKPYNENEYVKLIHIILKYWKTIHILVKL